jgi:hypothetical protein
MSDANASIKKELFLFILVWFSFGRCVGDFNLIKVWEAIKYKYDFIKILWVANKTGGRSFEENEIILFLKLTLNLE